MGAKRKFDDDQIREIRACTLTRKQTAALYGTTCRTIDNIKAGNIYTDVPGLVLSTYFDAGHVRLSHDGSDGSETLKGWGLAASYTRPGDWFARLDYARRIGDSKYLSEDAKSKGRVWFLLGKIW